MKRCQTGQSATEYLVATALLVALFTLPLDGRTSLVTLWQTAIRVGYTRFLFALAGLV